MSNWSVSSHSIGDVPLASRVATRVPLEAILAMFSDTRGVRRC